MYLNGQYRHSIDQKNRLSIPNKLRNEIGCELVVSFPTNGTDKCLYIFSKEDWLKIVASCNETLEGSARTKMQRRLGINSDNVTADSQGRIIINANLLKKANIDKDVLIFGAGQRIEIWNPDEWDNLIEEEEELEENGEAVVFHMPF